MFELQSTWESTAAAAEGSPATADFELFGAVGEALFEGVHPVGLPLGQRQGHLQIECK